MGLLFRSDNLATRRRFLWSFGIISAIVAAIVAAVWRAWHWEANRLFEEPLERVKVEDQAWHTTSSPDGMELMESEIFGGAIALSRWRAADGRRLGSLKIGFPAKYAVYSLDGNRIALGGSNEIRVLDRRTGAEQFTLKPLARVVTKPAFSSDGRWLLATGVNQLFVWNLAESPTLRTKSVTGIKAVAACKNPDEGIVVKHSTEGEVVRLSNLQIVATLPAVSPPQFPVATTVSADGSFLAIVGSNGKVGIRDLVRRAVIADVQLPLRGGLAQLQAEFVADGSVLAVSEVILNIHYAIDWESYRLNTGSTADSSQYHLFDVRDGRPLRTWRCRPIAHKIFPIPGQRKFRDYDGTFLRTWSIERPRP